MRFPASIERTRALLDVLLNRAENPDMKRRDFTVYRREASVYFVDGMVSSDFLQRDLLHPCQMHAGEALPEAMAQALLALLPLGEGEETDNVTQAVEQLMGGQALMVADGMMGALCFDIRGYVRRGVSTPQAEAVVEGQHQAFNESLRDNVTLIRRLLPTPALIGETLSVGDGIPLGVSLMYLKDRADEATVARMRGRIAQLRIDHVLSIGELQQLVEDHPAAVLPQCCLTERPDRAASFLLEGQVVLVLDGSPRVLAAPVSFLHLFHTPDDMAMRWPYGLLTRLVRLLAALMTLLLPGLFVAFTLFHPEALPVTLLTSVLESQAAVPLSIPGEMALMLLMVNLISEAGIRVPGVVGSSIGTVSGLILGQAAVEAKLVHPLMVIVVAVAALGNYALPEYALTLAFRILQMVFLAAACVGGVYGMALVGCVLAVRLCAMRSFGSPMAAPVAPGRLHNPDLILRTPIWRQRLTTWLASAAHPVRAAGKMRAWRSKGGK